MIVDKKSIEVEGSTLEDAIKKAVLKLKVPREKMVIRVVSEEQKGLFGMQGVKPCKIIVARKETK